ncbi:hypothetical protein GYMLUDRAFT_50398 [Collybiopsis luxurians FD-317 M1]|uniref:HECT-type E3 ubiquitin transferase n=1 Tax=Collybiopsis luxurians FD-317 M1 TaxID=944289 RepID=A0A0D0AN62_9AGAR|nr:hypothetical protein GYMLUDRAFT_50398 [Collybiopsis luxurians FD-317 M1]
MFNPSRCLFNCSAHDSYTFQINPASGDHPGHLDDFKFIGRCLGLAIFHRRFSEAYFVVSLYKMILQKEVALADLECINAEIYSRMIWILENDMTNVIGVTFTTTEEQFGNTVTIELKPGGARIPVTEKNKREYVKCAIDYYISKQVKEQFDAFMSGFNDLIPQNLITIFDEHELDLLINGMSNIDVKDWQTFTEYQGYKLTDEVIQWFWKCVSGWTPERKCRLLQLATGSSRVPINGFQDLQGSDGPKQFIICRSDDPSQLPKGNPRFNRIDLPWYKDYATLEHKLTLAVAGTTEPGTLPTHL